MTLAITKLPALQKTLTGWNDAGESVAFVPTMGALHAGHLALVQEAKRHARRVVVSIFVNPTQFGPNEDFNRYPRPLEEDLSALEAAGVDAAWLPSVETMYPQGIRSTIHLGGVTEILEGAIRPGHFDGVATVVSRLFDQVKPNVAIFGEKDFQQLFLIRQMVNELKLPIAIIGVPTLREGDGLALSSRNRYLSDEQRKTATKLNQVLRHTQFALKEGRPVAECLEKAGRLMLDGGFDAVDYVALVREETFEPLAEYKVPARLLAAARLGTTRLIDNVRVA